MLKAQEIDSILQDITKSRLGFEMRWYIVDRFLEGVHFEREVEYKEGQVKLVQPKFVKGVKPISISRADKQIESILNILFFNKPIWKVYPLSTDIEAIQNADRMSDFFDILWDIMDMKKKIKKATKNALCYNIAYLEVGIDFNNNIFIEEYSPWQIYHDCGIENLEQTRFLIKVVKKTIEDLKLNESYNQEVLKEIKPETKEALSVYQEARFKEKFNQSVKLPDENKNFVFVKEVWFKENGEWYLGTECQGKWLREPQKVPYFPFVAVQIQEGDIYQTSLVEKLIPLNKEIDLLAAYIKNFIYACSMGKFLEPKGAKIERILDEHGERIRYEGGREPRVMDVPQLSPTVIAYLQLMTQFMDERGTSVVSFGKLPSKKLGWKALESLKQIELGNMQGIIENIQDVLKDLAYKILEVGESAWIDQIYQIFYPKGILKVLSAQAFGTRAEFMGEDILPISTKWGIKVEIESGLAYTEEGKRETMLELLKAGVVAPDEVREKLKLGPSPIKEAEKAIKITQQQKIGGQLPSEIQTLPKVAEIPIIPQT